MHGRLLLPGGRKRPPFPPRYSQLPATTSSTRRLQAQGRHQSDLNAITPPASPPRRRFKPAISSTPCPAAQHADTTRQAAVYDTVVLVKMIVTASRGPSIVRAMRAHLDRPTAIIISGFSVSMVASLLIGLFHTSLAANLEPFAMHAAALALILAAKYNLFRIRYWGLIFLLALGVS